MNSNAKAPVFISGVGAVSCLGPDMAALWSAVLENRTGIAAGGLGRVEDAWLSDVPAELRANRVLAMSWKGAREAMAQAGWATLRPGDGLILATTTGQILEWDKAYVAFTDAKIPREEFRAKFRQQPLGGWMQALGEDLGHDGPRALLSSACTAATQALGLAAMWIRQGKCRRVLVGGAEVICDLTSAGFGCLQLLASEPCTPFDAGRRGINLSEGAAFLCIETAPVKPLARISGFGFSTDAFHMTGPHPEGDGSYRAMQDALAVAGLEPRAIEWVHAHGTGSNANDLSEGLAVARLFAAGVEAPYVSSTKWLHGHALGASGALETALIVKAMQEKKLLHTRGLKTPDPKIPVKHPGQDMPAPLKHVLKNTLGFGGANSALVLSSVEVGR